MATHSTHTACLRGIAAGYNGFSLRCELSSATLAGVGPGSTLYVFRCGPQARSSLRARR